MDGGFDRRTNSGTIYTATIHALIRRVLRHIIPAAKVDNQDALKKPLAAAELITDSGIAAGSRDGWFRPNALAELGPGSQTAGQGSAVTDRVRQAGG